MADPDTTRIINTDPDRTHMADPDRTRMADPDRTRMAPPPGVAPRALTLTATPGGTYALSSDTTREHLLFEIGATGAGRGAAAAQHRPGD